MPSTLTKAKVQPLVLAIEHAFGSLMKKYAIRNPGKIIAAKISDSLESAKCNECQSACC